jgi:Concanavalin A-like lectin/glucanases superfamily
MFNYFKNKNNFGVMIVSMFLIGSFIISPQISEASWSFNSLPWVVKIKSALTRTRVNGSFNNSLTAGLMGVWSFDGPDMLNGTVFDRSGQGNHAYFVNMSTSTALTIGKIGQGLYFSNGIDYLESEESDTHDFGENPFSISIWFKTTFAGAGARMIDKRAVCFNDNFWEVGISSGTFYGCVDDGTLSCVGGATTVNDDEWHHGVFIRDGMDLYAYVDGVLDNTAVANTLADVSNSAPLRIGDSVCVNDYVGHLDEARIYNRALSAGEAKRLYGMAR